MSKRSCEDCKWDRLNQEGKRMIQCGQGHARTFEKVIENCHAWEKKEKCWCELKNPQSPLWKYLPGYPDKKNTALPMEINFCPECGKRLGVI